ncbi:MAG: HD domain-containing protein [Rubripirellula sp.]|nr:HD domain-containing protein [Rubripirellula sp.]
MNNVEILERVESEVRKRLANYGAGHGFDHIERVVSSALKIQVEAGGDRFVIELSALLHDVGDAKFHQGVERSGEISRQLLSDYAADPRIIDHVVHIVDNLSFRKRHSAELLSLEGQVVQDADRLDALGAIGIIRTIEYGESVGQPFYVSGDPAAKSGLGHFHDKLFKLRELMNTDAGKRMAGERESFMRAFIHQFESETNM